MNYISKKPLCGIDYASYNADIDYKRYNSFGGTLVTTLAEANITQVTTSAVAKITQVSTLAVA